jgi:ectoine hydroxylase-related dioxygenase (phytanoyl-CoA dioxygenase family)
MAEPSIFPQHMNPELTPELEREVAFFLKWGYLIVEEAVTMEQVDTLRAALDEAFTRLDAAELEKGQFIHQLLEKDDRFAFLLDNPPVMTRMKAILGNCVQLHSATARITSPGEQDQGWHRDGPWPMDPEGTPYGSMPGQINCGYFLDELTMKNGPIAIVPGSQRALFKPPEGHPTFPDEKFVLAKSGQAVFFDGWLYHRGVANTSDQERRVCLMCYQNAWMKSREPFDGPKVTAMKENGTPEQKLLLGGIDKW